MSLNGYVDFLFVIDHSPDIPVVDVRVTDIRCKSIVVQSQTYKLSKALLAFLVILPKNMSINQPAITEDMILLTASISSSLTVWPMFE